MWLFVFYFHFLIVGLISQLDMVVWSETINFVWNRVPFLLCLFSPKCATFPDTKTLRGRLCTPAKIFRKKRQLLTITDYKTKQIWHQSVTEFKTHYYSILFSISNGPKCFKCMMHPKVPCHWSSTFQNYISNFQKF